MNSPCVCLQRQWQKNGAQCGVCGDPYDGPRDHEPGGKFYTGEVTRTYTQGKVGLTVLLIYTYTQGKVGLTVLLIYIRWYLGSKCCSKVVIGARKLLNGQKTAGSACSEFSTVVYQQ